MAFYLTAIVVKDEKELGGSEGRLSLLFCFLEVIFLVLIFCLFKMRQGNLKAK